MNKRPESAQIGLWCAVRGLQAMSPRPLPIGALIWALFVSGCATPIPTTVVESPKPLPPVEIIVAQPCLIDGQIEAVPPSSMPKSSNIAELANGAAVDAVTYRLLAERQNKQLKACASAVKGVKP